jgi:hypothetical protein
MENQLRNSPTSNGDLTQEQLEVARDGLGYEPSVKVKKTFLPLRKHIRVWGGVQYPGLFDYDPANDAGWFWFTVMMEVISLGTAAFLLEERVEMSILIISAMSVFFLDFACAYFHHKYKSVESLADNQMRLFLPEMRTGLSAADSYANYYGYVEQKLKDNVNRKYMRHVFSFMIWILSLLKGGIFFIAVFSSYWFQTAVIDSKAPYLLIFVILSSYIWIAFNHVKFSGYYLAARSHEHQFSTEQTKYKRELYKSEINVRQDEEDRVNFNVFLDTVLAEKKNPFLSFFTKKSKDDFKRELSEGLVEMRVKAGTHFIRKLENGEYIFHRKGFITDEQVNELVKAQKNQLAELAVAMYFHKLQMTSANFNTDILD